MEPFEAIILLGFIALIIVVVIAKENRLNDPSRTDTIFVDQMRSTCVLDRQPVSASLIRQSGNLYRELGLFDDADAAFDEIEKSFQRAKIESVFVQRNDTREFRVVRLHHSHGGKAEGKKLGGAIVCAADPQLG